MHESPPGYHPSHTGIQPHFFYFSPLKGLLRGKKAMLAVTTGGPKEFYSKEGVHAAEIVEMLHPIIHGTLFFCGMDVLPPFVAYSVFQAGEEGRKRYLEEYKNRLLGLETTPLFKSY